MEHSLISGETGLRKCGRCDHCSSIFGFECEVYQLEVLLVILRAILQLIIDEGRSILQYGILTCAPTCSSISMLTKASNACLKEEGMSR